MKNTPDEVPAIRVEEHLKISISEKNSNIAEIETKVTLNKRV